MLKVGSQVMCTANLDLENGVCNGSTGIVNKFINGHPVVTFSNGYTKVMAKHTWESSKYEGLGISQYPLILAWAVTIHKLQGATLDYAEMDIGSNIFETGQTYVALSRVRSLEGLFIKSYNRKKIKVDKRVIEFYSTAT